MSVKYQNQTLEEVITDLKQRTDYSFVYQKRILEGKEAVTAEFMNVPLEYILDRVLLPADLEYEIVEKSVIIRAMDKGTFRQVVSGKVTDEDGLPVPGVNVRVKDTQSGVATDINGDFSIMVDSGHPFLVFSFMGMLDKEVRVTRDTKSPLAIQMQADVKLMDEVVVTGYQNIKRENATGSYQVLSTRELGNRYTENIVSNLEGRIPGLMSYSNGSKSGEEALTIRGVSSFQARTNPLVVVDGLPIEGSIETVNPYDIENITVLKDASATSIYGARAANGVIVITTKRATEEKLSIDVSADWTVSELQTYDNYNWATPAQVVDLEEMNFEYVKTKPDELSQIESYWSERPYNLSPIMQLMYGHYIGEVSDSTYNAQMEEWRGNDYRKEWQDVMQRRQFVQQYNVAFRTRGKYLNSSIVVNYKGNNTGTVNQYDRALTLSYKGDMNLTKFLDVSVGLNLINENTKTHADMFGYKGMHAFSPYMSMYNPDGSLRHKLVGSADPDEFMECVKVAFDDEKAFGTLQAKYESGNRDKAFLARYIQALLDAYDPDAPRVAKELFDSLTDEEKVSGEYWFLFSNDQLAAYGSEFFHYLLANHDKFVASLGAEKVDGYMASLYENKLLLVAMGNDQEITAESINRMTEEIKALGLAGGKTLLSLADIAGAALSGDQGKVLATCEREVKNMPGEKFPVILAVIMKDKATPAQIDRWVNVLRAAKDRFADKEKTGDVDNFINYLKK